ncbi:hypothetical protein AB0H57_25485 [Micromonospora sp. NPDC050686]|uniref:hypothetical protein n=1 Tax=Micromonospora sp. NPDC050686 TaxID=3154631 RepID=UPI003411797F
MANTDEDVPAGTAPEGQNSGEIEEYAFGGGERLVAVVSPQHLAGSAIAPSAIAQLNSL